MRTLALTLVSSLALPLAASAGELVHVVPFGPVAIGASAHVQLPKFDGSAGVLRAAGVTVSGWVDGQWSFENTGAQPASVGGYASLQWIGALIPVQAPGGGMPAPNPGYVGEQTLLAPFDGAVDFGGASGVTDGYTHESGDGGPSQYLAVYWDAGLALYAGSGQFDVALGPMIRYGPATLPPGVVDGSTVFVSGTVEVTYSYDPLPAAICRAAAFSGCPCSNPGAFGHGCANSAGAQGGLLTASGSSSLSADTLVLAGSGMPDSSALYFQGSAFEYAQIPYGDGLRCVAGSIVRLATKANASGASRFPSAGDPSVSVRGGVATPGTRYYQVVYRDRASYCTPSTVNATSGMAILWSL